MRRFFLAATICCLATSAVFAQEMLTDVVYAKRGKLELRLDIAFPEGDAQMRPALMCIHGGGWRAGDKKSYHSRMKVMAKNGYVAATVQYRLSGVAPWPAQRDDVNDAFEWLVAHAKELRIDPERIGLVGESAGGHLALCHGMRPEQTANQVRPRAIINCFGPTDMRDMTQIDRARPMVAALVGADDARIQEAGDKLADVSPLLFADRTDPPVLTIHGTDDDLVPFKQAKLLDAALQKNLVPHVIYPMEGVGHGYGNHFKAVQDTINDFGRQYLKGSEMPLVASEDFDAGSDGWEFTEDSAWTVNKKDARTYVSLTKKKSDYKPEVRSPHNIALMKKTRVGDFVLDVDMRSTNEVYGHQDLCLFFGHQDPSHFYYVHLGRAADAHANSIFLVNGEPRVSIATKRTEGTDWSRGWHRVRIKRDIEKGSIEVFFDDMKTPVMSTIDKTFGSGRIGIGSFDDTGDFDAIRLWGRAVE